MSNISRRDFLKTAGVMTLAVAAAGVLAGCNNNTVAPAPEANKPEVTTNSVSFTGLYGDKLTVESLGRFDAYASADAKAPRASQILLKVTYTKPGLGTPTNISAVSFDYANGTDATMITDYANKLDAAVKAHNTAVTALANDVQAVIDGANGKLKNEAYLAVAMKDIESNTLNVKLTFIGADKVEKTEVVQLASESKKVF